ncbi:MAG TPA: ABC transporter permease [Candidatus Moranbacteria bacterium]|nr:ABC transporter permease [Candidatus Moranbacteria bacterium]
MSFKRIYVIFIRQWFLFRSNPIRLVTVFLWGIMNIVLWGFITKYLGTLGQAAFSFATALLGAIILSEFMNRIQQGIMTSFLEDIWSQNFINFFASPLEIREYLGGLVLTSIITSLASFAVLILLAGIIFGYNILEAGLFILPFLLILFLFGMAVGLFITAIIFRFGPAAEWLGWPLPFLLSIFSGVFYPIATLPSAFQILARLIPASYVFESFRSILSGNYFFSGLLSNLLVGTALAIFYLMLAYIFFLRVYRANLRSGALARFGAEV